MQIETERLLLRDFVLEDAEALVACRSDDRYWRYYTKPDDIAAATRQHVELFVGWQKAEPRTHFQLAIVLKEPGQLIGDCGLRLRAQVPYGEDGPLEADIGYELDPAYWRHGYATEAVRALVDYGFSELGLHRIWTFAVADNEPSWRLMERIGMRREGLLKGNVPLQGGWADTVVYGLLAEEWAASR